MSTTVSIPESLYGRLREIASEKGCTPDALVEEIVADALGPSLSADARVATRTRTTSGRASTAAEWDIVEKELAATEPHFATVEDAMSHVRGRRWRKAD